MKSKSKLPYVIGIILLSFTSIYPSNKNEDKKKKPSNEMNSFWVNHQLNWKNTNEFNANNYWNQEENNFFNDNTVTISNKKIATSTDDSFEDNKGNNEPTDVESGNIRWKGFRFQNLNIPANAIINNVELIAYGYKQGKTTVNVKAENLKSPTSYTDDDDYLSSRSTTSKSVDWYIPKLSNGLELKSPNLKDVVQEVVNSNNGITHLSLIISSSKKWECWNFDDRSSSYYPKINISYTVNNPDVSDDIHTMDENTVASIPVLNNDENIPTTGTITITKNPKNGTATITDLNNTPNNLSDDTITYTPTPNYDGTDTFAYKVCDSNNNCDSANVSVTINTVVDPCDAALSGNLDTDNDGIADVCDLDDDNDGILDEDECPDVNPFTFKLNINNKKFTNSNQAGDIGDVMLYKNVGTHNGVKIDLKLTVTANSDPQNMTIDISGFKFGNDIYPILLDGNNTKEIPYATVKFEFLKNNTSELVNVAPSFMFKDIDFLSDGTGESVEINKNLISSYTLSKTPTTDLYINDDVTKNYQGTNGNFLRINSKKEGSGLNNENLWISMQLSEVNSFNINFLKRTGNTGYVIESDTFSKSGNTVQLDADCSLDSDADGIPNYLDTDSDNDGCPDATEAEKNIATTATLAGGSNGGSSANLGVKSNKNGIPLPFGTENGSETKGQQNTDASKTAEKISVNTTEFNITQNKHQTANFTIDASAVKTNTFANGIPNYDNPNGTDTSNSLTYEWYKKSDLTKRLATNKTLNIYNVTADKTGEYVVIISGINSSCSEEATFNLIINDTPTAQNDFFKVDEDSQNAALKILDNDDFGDDQGNGTITLATEISEKNATISINDNGTPNNPKDDFVVYTPVANFNGSDSFNYTITDASGDSSTTRVGLYVNAVNDLPTAANDTVTIDEDSPEITINVTENDDFGGDGFGNGRIIITNTYSSEKGKISIDTNGTQNNPTDDKVKYTPLEGFNGTDTFTYKIQDANGDSSTATVTVTINSVNDIPTAKSDKFAVLEDSSSNIIDVLINDNFGDDGKSNGPIVLVTTTSNDGGTLTVDNNSTPNNPSDDTILYTPVTNFNGQDTFEYKISDIDGDTATATVTITVTSVNDTPTVTSDAFSINEDSTNNVLDVLNNDSFGGDGANDSTIKIVTTTAEGSTISVDDNGTPNDPTDDKIVYTPANNFNGVDTFTYTITDANGDTKTGTVTITVNAVNDLPTATADSISVDEDSSDNLINVTNNDDFGGDGTNAGTISIASNSTIQNGTITVDDNGTSTDPTDDNISYTPASNFNGSDSFEYTITDADGDKATATVSITVIAVNDLPTATSDSITVDEDATDFSIDILSNDDFGGDGASSGTISLTSETSNKGGTLSIDKNGTENDPTDDKILYSPALDYNGSDTFEYAITDSNGDTSTAIVNITVNAVNDLPTATNDTFTFVEDSSNNIIKIFNNDSFGGDGAASSNYYEIGDLDKEGRLLVRPARNNRVSAGIEHDIIYYTPAENFNGIETFSYAIIDANGDKATATVSITVTGTNDSPVSINDNITVDENSTNTVINVLENDSFGGDGASSSAITIANATSENGGIVSVNDNGTATDPTDDTIIFTPLANFTGTDSFEYSISDADAEVATSTVTITINPTGKKYNPLAATECFNIFVKNNLTLTNGNTSGSIAVGGDLIFNENYTLASEDCGCFAINDVNIGLLVGGNVNYPDVGILSINSKNQYAKIGAANNNIWYQDPNNASSPIRITKRNLYEEFAYIQLAGTAEDFSVSNSVNPVIQQNIIDFDIAFQQLQEASLSMASELNNASVLDADNQEIALTNLPSEIVINTASSVSYLNITGDDLNQVSQVSFFNKPNANAVLIVNVNTDESFDWNVWKQENITQEEGSYIIYNFYNAKTVNIEGSNEVIGSIFAPLANIIKTTNTANISGQIIGQSLAIENGSINCNSFQNDIYSPKNANVIPVADFKSNDNNQCVTNNTFEFENLSNTGSNTQPTAPISYAWDFGDGTTSSLMNPTHNYSESGTYSVKLTATNAYGSSEKTLQVVVESIIIADVIESNSTKDEDAGAVTKEFTLNNDIDFTEFTWSLPGFDTSELDNQKTISFEFTEEGEYVLLINTKNNDCTNAVKIPITITSDEVSTGNDGGLESESLGDAISIRYLQRKMKSVPTIFSKSSKNVYNKKKMVKSLAKKNNELTMLEMFPEQLVDGDVAHVTSPTDILDYTVADEVLSVDFSTDDKTIGVVLGVKTIDQIYNHTKATCDRLRGAEILNVKTVEIAEYNFLQQAIKQRSGVIEHAISFAVSKNNADNFYRLQTNWYVFDYKAANDVFNFQVWASEPANTVKMVTEILANLNASLPLEQVEKQKIPKTFVTKVSRVSDKLNLELKSINETEDIEIAIDEKLNETTANINSRYTPLTTKTTQTLQLDINDGYEYDGDIVLDDEVQDAFYHADGNWGLEYDRRYTTVNEYEISNNLDREYKDDELPINRNVSIKAYSEYDYLAVYKSLLPGTIAADYSAYNYLSFKASGQGPTQLVLVKSGIENWSEQFRATVNLTEEEQTFYVPFESFTSTATTDRIIADDLTTISFTYIAVDAGTNNLDLKISDVKFTKTNTSLSVDEFISPKKNEFFAYPNPTKGDVNCTIFSDVNTKAKATLIDITGKTIYEDVINLSEGKNELKFNFKAKNGVLFLKINSNEINYGTSKIIFR